MKTLIIIWGLVIVALFGLFGYINSEIDRRVAEDTAALRAENQMLNTELSRYMNPTYKDADLIKIQQELKAVGGP